ncbi:TetR family transcriptional regulator [Heyndrickxia sporothermodurans]|nr:TetR family transcriptional regulator [Heyndrickxia sporothermodurans]
MNKRQYDSSKSKKDIMEKAFFLFSQKGYSQTSVGDISKASGYSKGHIYYHFENKEKLFVLLAQNTMREWHEKWISKEQSFRSAADKLYGIALHVLYNYQTPLLKAGQELSSSPSSSPDSVKRLYELAVIPMSTYRSIIQEGVDNGEFKDGNIEERTVLLGTWLGGLCQLTNTQQLSSLELLFKKAMTIFLESIKK